ncbi:hypothetical protein C5167_008230 [Papaver somniferum]|uniref:Uncharacterized protein n=1 Tax=Papaver somniferum TaxID=3469 RepID=A0A4Y7JVD3_PAPSO|nr:hypothetical protein C5167_008230 [Papaver somniferum]
MFYCVFHFSLNFYLERTMKISLSSGDLRIQDRLIGLELRGKRPLVMNSCIRTSNSSCLEQCMQFGMQVLDSYFTRYSYGIMDGIIANKERENL